MQQTSMLKPLHMHILRKLDSSDYDQGIRRVCIDVEGNRLCEKLKLFSIKELGLLFHHHIRDFQHILVEKKYIVLTATIHLVFVKLINLR